MKKFITICLILGSLLVYGQANESQKFKIGIGYSFTNKDGIYRRPWNVYADYRLKKWNQWSLAAGLRVFYFSSEVPDNFPNHFGYNPYVNGSCILGSSKIQANFGMGYYFHSYELTPTQSGLIAYPNRMIKTNGISVSPGIHYFVFRSVFLDANATFLLATTQNANAPETTANQTFIQLGLGLVF